MVWQHSVDGEPTSSHNPPMQKSNDPDGKLSFYRAVGQPVIERILALIGSIAIIYALIQFIFDRDVPGVIRQWGILFGVVLLAVIGVGFTIYRIYRLQQKQYQELKNASRATPYIFLPTIKEQLPPDFVEADEVFIFGLTLENLLRRYPSTLKSLAEHKQKQLKFLLPDLDHLATAVDSMALDWGQSYRFQQEITSSLEWLSELAEKSTASVEIKLVKQLPTVSMLCINPKSPDGKIRISLHLYDGSYENRPFFEISKRDHPQWFDYFIQRYYVTLWKDAIPWEPGMKGYAKRAGLLRQQGGRSNE